MHALVRFAHIAAGSTFTTAEIYPYVIKALGCAPKEFPRDPRWFFLSAQGGMV